MSVKVTNLLPEVIDSLFIELLLFVESVFGLHDDFVHVLVFFLKLSDFGDDIRAGAGPHALEEVGVFGSEVGVDSLEFIVLVFHGDLALVHVIRKVFFGLFENSYLFIEVVDDFFK